VKNVTNEVVDGNQRIVRRENQPLGHNCEVAILVHFAVECIDLLDRGTYIDGLGQ
jgi:hypothetical protein